MFDDFVERGAELEFGSGLSDREILHAIHCCGAVGDLSAEEGWAMLYERYPADPRFFN